MFFSTGAFDNRLLSSKEDDRSSSLEGLSAASVPEEEGSLKKLDVDECDDDDDALVIVGSVGFGRGGKAGAPLLVETDGAATDAEKAALGLETPLPSYAAAAAAA